MWGTTFHGDMDFDVPYVTKLTDDLWMGGCEVGLVLPDEVAHLVCLYPRGTYKVWHHLMSSMSVRLYDEANEPDRDLIVGLAMWVNACRKSGVVLVHCQAGLNRSGLVVALALVLDGMKPGEAVELLRRRRSPAVLCNPAFERWLLDFVV